jgi:NADH-quinone oxidoreductase subunit C
MSILEKTRQAFAELFPEEAAAAVAVDGATEEQTEKDSEAEGPILTRDYATRGFHLDVSVTPEQLVRAVEILFALDYFIESITGVDWPKEKQIEAVYDFCRYDFDLCRVVVRTRTRRDEPRLPTITGVYTGANWHERETHDFFGVVFDGHPNLIPLLLPEDADFHPLLKDFTA